MDNISFCRLKIRHNLFGICTQLWLFAIHRINFVAANWISVLRQSREIIRINKCIMTHPQHRCKREIESGIESRSREWQPFVIIYILLSPTMCFMDLDKFKATCWFYFRLNLFLLLLKLVRKILLISKADKSDPKIIISLLLPRLSLNLWYSG